MTPREMIRAEPFRHSKYVTQADEAWVAAMMHRDIRREQVARGFKPGALPQPPNIMSGRKKTTTPEEALAAIAQRAVNAKKAQAAIAKDRYTKIAEMMGDRSTTYAELGERLGIQVNSAAHVIAEMIRRGLVEFGGMRGKSKLYRVIPNRVIQKSH